MTPEMPVDGLKDQHTHTHPFCVLMMISCHRHHASGLSGTFLPMGFELSSGYTADGSQNPAMLVACLSYHYVFNHFLL